MTVKSRFLTILAILLGAYAIAHLAKKDSEDNQFASAPVLKELPQFKAKKLNGEEWSTQSLVGGDKVILVHFWGTWCAPCLTEFPGLVKFISGSETQGKLTSLLIATQDKMPEVKRFLSEHAPSLPPGTEVLLDDDGSVQKLFNTIKVPESYFFSKQLVTLQKLVGPQEWENPYYQNILGR